MNTPTKTSQYNSYKPELCKYVKETNYMPLHNSRLIVKLVNTAINEYMLKHESLGINMSNFTLKFISITLPENSIMLFK